MLKVVSTQKADEIIKEKFSHISPECEKVPLASSVGRVLYKNVVSSENIPPFDRSTVDGFAVIASDTFGSSESLPCQLDTVGEILMGESAVKEISEGECLRISTGGMLPPGADSVVMVENTETMPDGTTLVYKAISPLENVTSRGDDVKTGETVLEKGTRLSSKHIGILASLGISEVSCVRKIRVGIISSGDEIVPIEKTPVNGQIRDVNSHILSTLLEEKGCECKSYGIVSDCYEKLFAVTEKAARENDIVILSGGSSAGARDMTVKVISELGEVFLHGIAMKPGKPTIVGEIYGKAVFGLPGHPAAAYFTALRFIAPLVRDIYGDNTVPSAVRAVTAVNVSSNHGREEFLPVRVEDSVAYPIFRKSGVISLLGQADGYIVIDRNREGLAKGEEVTVNLF